MWRRLSQRHMGTSSWDSIHSHQKWHTVLVEAIESKPRGNLIIEQSRAKVVSRSKDQMHQIAKEDAGSWGGGGRGTSPVLLILIRLYS